MKGNFRLFLRLTLLVQFALMHEVIAEPWISTRFAQNCAACHAPGRVNRSASQRRCTLSCQGCHVNPNGGGIQTSYGIWNEQRWLRSIYVEGLLTNKRKPVPFAQQNYAKKEKAPTGSADPKSGLPAIQTDARKKPERRLYTTVTTDNEPVEEKLYDRSDGQEQVISESSTQFMEHVPVDDPFREERRTILTGGAQFRYMTTVPLSTAGPTDKEFNDKPYSWLMGVDLGVRVRPVRDYFSLVLESRFLNPPENHVWDQAFTTENRVRSAYVLIDDIPFNSYFMAGIYRPMFGLFNPDHDSISNVISGLGQRSIYKSVGIGSAPNVPFFNVNVISPLTSPNYDQSSGLNVNAGGRWVTLGASLVLSYWNTTSPDTAGNNLRNQMFAVTTGFALEPFILNTELLYVSREFGPGTSDSGLVLTNQLKVRFWRETYLEVNHAFSNAALTLKEGASDELIFGVRTFLIAGTDLEILYNYRRNRTVTTTQAESQIQGMIHLFY